jgi:HD superfamily phosphodiesterase
MKTPAGRRLAQERTARMREFIAQLQDEIDLRI